MAESSPVTPLAGLGRVQLGLAGLQVCGELIQRGPVDHEDYRVRLAEAQLDALSSALDPAELARASLRAIGLGYLDFALTETGLFRTIFAVPYEWPSPPDPAKAGATGLNPFQLLGVALDRMVAAGVLPKERRLGAEFLAWSTVHGFAMLVIDGPLHDFARPQIDALGQRAVAMVEQGL